MRLKSPTLAMDGMRPLASGKGNPVMELPGECRPGVWAGEKSPLGLLKFVMLAGGERGVRLVPVDSMDVRGEVEPFGVLAPDWEGTSSRALESSMTK